MRSCTLILAMIFAALLFKPAKGHAQTQPVSKKRAVYVCSPCGYDCDARHFAGPGICPSCHMPLVKKSTISFKNISPSAMATYLRSHPNTILLDVRTKAEFDGKADPNFGTLKNAINIPVQELQDKLPAIDSLRQKEIIVYCSHAHRSAQASYLLSQHGFHKVRNMTGGVSVMSDSSFMPIFR